MGARARTSYSSAGRGNGGYFGPAVEDMASSIPSSPETIRNLIRRFEEVGADELVCWPTVAELDQVHRLADLVG